MDRILSSAKFIGKIRIGNNEVNCLAYADDGVILAENERKFQENSIDLERSCIEFGLKKISIRMLDHLIVH